MGHTTRASPSDGSWDIGRLRSDCFDESGQGVCAGAEWIVELGPGLEVSLPVGDVDGPGMIVGAFICPNAGGDGLNDEVDYLLSIGVDAKSYDCEDQTSGVIRYLGAVLSIWKSSRDMLNSKLGII